MTELERQAAALRKAVRVSLVELGDDRVPAYRRLAQAREDLASLGRLANRLLRMTARTHRPRLKSGVPVFTGRGVRVVH